MFNFNILINGKIGQVSLTQAFRLNDFKALQNFAIRQVWAVVVAQLAEQLLPIPESAV